jgi:hypothetical protein
MKPDFPKPSESSSPWDTDSDEETKDKPTPLPVPSAIQQTKEIPSVTKLNNNASGVNPGLLSPFLEPIHRKDLDETASNTSDINFDYSPSGGLHQRNESADNEEEEFQRSGISGKSNSFGQRASAVSPIAKALNDQDSESIDIQFSSSDEDSDKLSPKSPLNGNKNVTKDSHSASKVTQVITDNNTLAESTQFTSQIPKNPNLVQTVPKLPEKKQDHDSDATSASSSEIEELSGDPSPPKKANIPKMAVALPGLQGNVTLPQLKTSPTIAENKDVAWMKELKESQKKGSTQSLDSGGSVYFDSENTDSQNPAEEKDDKVTEIKTNGQDTNPIPPLPDITGMAAKRDGQRGIGVPSRPSTQFSNLSEVTRSTSISEKEAVDVSDVEKEPQESGKAVLQPKLDVHLNTESIPNTNLGTSGPANKFTAQSTLTTTFLLPKSEPSEASSPSVPKEKESALPQSSHQLGRSKEELIQSSHQWKSVDMKLPLGTTEASTDSQLSKSTSNHEISSSKQSLQRSRQNKGTIRAGATSNEPTSSKLSVAVSTTSTNSKASQATTSIKPEVPAKILRDLKQIELSCPTGLSSATVTSLVDNLALSYKERQQFLKQKSAKILKELERYGIKT